MDGNNLSMADVAPIVDGDEESGVGYKKLDGRIWIEQRGTRDLTV